MDHKKKINRKRFFRWAGTAMLIPFAAVWKNSVSQKEKFATSSQTLTLDDTLPDGVHFFDRVILIKEKDNIELFSSRCTHLGCQINKIENGTLVCPCHGSRFNFSGNPVNGPAVKNLEKIDFRKIINNGKTTIQFKI